MTTQFEEERYFCGSVPRAAVADSETECMKFIAAAFLAGNPDPARLDSELWRLCGELMVRDRVVEKFGFAVLGRATIELLKQYGPILEIGSGSGYWSYELRNAGIDVIPTDPQTATYRFGESQGRWKDLWVPIEKLTAQQALAKYPGRTLLTVWPDLDGEWVGEALASFPGPTLIYVGESQGGCTANDKFFELLEQGWSEILCHDIPQFRGIHDCLYVYRRRVQRLIQMRGDE
jgi:hypothetical protein